MPSGEFLKAKQFKRYSMFRISRDKKPAKTLNEEPQEKNETASKN